MARPPAMPRADAPREQPIMSRRAAVVRRRRCRGGWRAASNDSACRASPVEDGRGLVERAVAGRTTATQVVVVHRRQVVVDQAVDVDEFHRGRRRVELLEAARRGRCRCGVDEDGRRRLPPASAVTHGLARASRAGSAGEGGIEHRLDPRPIRGPRSRARWPDVALTLSPRSWSRRALAGPASNGAASVLPSRLQQDLDARLRRLQSEPALAGQRDATFEGAQRLSSGRSPRLEALDQLLELLQRLLEVGRSGLAVLGGGRVRGGKRDVTRAKNWVKRPARCPGGTQSFAAQTRT